MRDHKRIDGRWVVELPSGIIKYPKICRAGTDLKTNDVVWGDGVVYPMYDNAHDMLGVVAANGFKGGLVLIAGRS